MEGVNESVYTLVPCQTTNKYLKFSNISHIVNGEELVVVYLMQKLCSSTVQAKELCTLFIKKENLEKVLENAEPLE